MGNVDEIALERKRRDLCRDAEFRQLVRDVAAGVEVDPAKAADILERANRSHDELLAEAERLERRAGLRAVIAAASAARAEQHELRDQVKAFDARLATEREAAEARHRAAVAPLLARIQTLSYDAAADLGAKLEISRLGDPQTLARISELEARQRTARQRLHVLAGFAGRPPHGCTTRDIERETAQLDRQVKDADEELTELRAQLRDD